MSESESYKQVIVARSDLGLSPGKLSAQVAHASVNATEQAREIAPEACQKWLNGQYTKIVLEGDDADQLRRLQQAAEESGIPNSLITDAGHTEIESGTVTAMAVGPEAVSEVDALTGDLPLYPK